MKRWKRIGAALLCAAVLTGTGAARAAAAELDTEEPAQTETQAAGIVTAAALDGADTAYSFTQRPALEELLEQFPDTILLTLEGQEEPVEVAVSWCSQVDYEDTDFYYYVFEAQWDEDAYPRSETLTDGDLPVLDVFLAEMEGGSGESGIMTASTSSNESTIYTYLTDTLGLNTAAACGVLANMYTESGLDPTITSSSGGYYGLCQWSSTRLSNLKSLYPSSYDTVSGQMGFTAQELGGLWDSAVKTSSYLRSVPNTEEGASNAAYYFAKYFEGCSSSSYETRQRLATDTYWAKYGDSSTSTVTISGYTLPVTMTTGTAFSVSGTLSSSKTITKVTAGCYTKSGDKVSGCYESVTPNATSYDLSNLDDDLLFSQLSPGIYKYKVTATTSAGTETVFSLTFTVLAKAATVSDGSYYIYSTQNSGNAVAVEDDSTSANANIELASGSGTTAQKFKITYVSSGYYKIINASSGLALAVKNGTPITGTNVRQESYDGDDNQLWQILPTGSDSYCLVPKCATQCCLASAGSSSGSNIRISTESLSAAQCWTLSTSSLLATPVLSGVTGTSSGVTVEWETVSGAAKYRVFRKVSGGSWTKLTDTTSTSYTDTTAEVGTAYIYTVRCINSDATSYTSSYDSAGLSITYAATPALTSAVGTSGGVTVKWSAATGASKYRLYRKTSGNSWTKIGDTTSTNYTDTTAQAGTTYIYTVRCINSKGTAFTSGYDTTGLSIACAATPTLTSVNGASNGVTVEWKAATGASKYRVFRKVSGDTAWTKLGDTTSTDYIDTTAQAGVTYSYTVRCVASSGYTSGYDADGLSITYADTPVLTGVCGTSDGVLVKWSAATGASKYRLYRKTAGSSWSMVEETTDTSCTDTTAQAGVTYYYTVRCINSKGTAFTSGYDTAGLSITYAATPTLTGISASADGVTVTWDAADGATGYRVFRRVSGESAWTKLEDTEDTSYTDATAQAGVTYEYTVRCIASSGYTSGYDADGLSITAQ